MSLETFRDEFLNKMDERELEREVLPDGTRTRRNRVSLCRNRVSLYGQRMIERLDGSELFQTLIDPGRRAKETIDRLTADLELERI
jgi:hypothetical protein